jgi:hypothetical protein
LQVLVSSVLFVTPVQSPNLPISAGHGTAWYSLRLLINTQPTQARALGGRARSLRSTPRAGSRTFLGIMCLISSLDSLLTPFLFVWLPMNTGHHGRGLLQHLLVVCGRVPAVRRGPFPRGRLGSARLTVSFSAVSFVTTPPHVSGGARPFLPAITAENL